MMLGLNRKDASLLLIVAILVALAPIFFKPFSRAIRISAV